MGPENVQDMQRELAASARPRRDSGLLSRRPLARGLFALPLRCDATNTAFDEYMRGNSSVAWWDGRIYSYGYCESARVNDGAVP